MPNGYKLLVKSEIPNQKTSSLVRFKTNVLQRVKLKINFFYDASDLQTNFFKHVKFKKNLRCLRFCFNFFSKNQILNEVCFQKITFRLNLPRKMDEFCIFALF